MNILPHLRRLRVYGVLFSCILVAAPTYLDAAVSAADQIAARAALLAGVGSIHIVGSPGRVAVFDPAGSVSGQGAFAVTRDSEWDTGICAAIWGSGRVLAFPHNGYLNFNDYAATNDTARLYSNCIQWAGNSALTTLPIVTNRDKAATWLTAQGFINVSQRADWENGLTGASLLVIELRTLSAGQATALRAFIQGGGGLITGGTGWGYKQAPGSDLKTLSGNVFLREAGLAWADGFTTMNPIQRATTLGNASAALDFAQSFWAGTLTGSAEQKAEAGAAMITVQDILPAGDPLQTRLDMALSTRAGGLGATPATPVSDPLDKVVLTWEAGRLAETVPANVTAHHTAEALYGAIPANPDRSQRTVPVNTDQNRWLSTGMYAEPGQLVTLTFPSSLVGKGYFVRISGHVDNISPRSSWERMPFGVGRTFPIDASTIEVASAFGGAIYVDVGKTGRPNLGRVDITTTGAIKAPYFILGGTTNAAWVGGIRDYPAPYAELECSGVILAVPSAWIRHLDDPESLMAFWDETVARQDWVAAHETMRSNPERINLDVQISVGLLHAGYPQQGPTDYNTVSVDGALQGRIVNLEELRKQGDWGWFHELGHEMQGRPDDSGNHYTFDGDGEVTVNIFANAAQEWGVPAPGSSGWGWSNYPEEVMQRAIATVNNARAANFDSKDPYPFYFQLADGFDGWQTYRDVMAIYGANHAADKAANLNNQQKKDLWLRRWSQASGFNMVEYMVNRWKLEVSQSAIDEVNAMIAPGGGPLPGWMPLASSLRKASAISGAPVILDLAAAGMSLDGTAILVDVSSPVHGSLTDNGNGTFTYRSSPGFVGVDDFSATYQSSAGNTQAFATEVVTRMAAPTVTTPAAGSITATGATLGGNVTSDGGATITERGVVYSATTTNGDPVIGGGGVKKVTASGSAGTFTAAVTGLTPATAYSFKAYATNGQDTSYTSVGAFTTLSTNADLSNLELSSGTLNPTFASATTSYTASVANANAISSITVAPTRSQASATIAVRVNGGSYSAVTSGSPSGALALNVGTNTVEVRATAQDGVTQKTYTVTVTRIAAPAVTGPTAANITSSSATLGGNVISDGGATITERGVVYSPAATNSNPTVGGAGVMKLSANTSTTGVFTVPAMGLAPGTSYRFKAYAINSQGTAYSGVAYFLTLSNNAKLGGLVLDGFGISPSFATTTTTYAATVQRSVGTVRIRPTSAHSGASLFARVNGGGWVPVSSGSLILPLTLEFGDNLVEVRVIAQDGAAEQLYSLEVFRNQPRPDAMVGRSVAFMGGANVYSSSSAQQLPLVATRAGAVSGYVAVANRGNRPDRFNYRGNGDNRYFKVEYRNATGALVSASVKAGLYRTSEMEPEAPVEWLRVTVTPVKKLIVVKKGKKTVTLRKAQTASINAASVLDPAVGDGVSIRVETW